MGHQNPANIKTQQCFEEAPELIRDRLVDQDTAFAMAMARAPEGKLHPRGVDKRPGNERSHRLRPPVTAVIRSSSGW